MQRAAFGSRARAATARSAQGIRLANALGVIGRTPYLCFVWTLSVLGSLACATGVTSPLDDDDVGRPNAGGAGGRPGPTGFNVGGRNGGAAGGGGVRAAGASGSGDSETGSAALGGSSSLGGDASSGSIPGGANAGGVGSEGGEGSGGTATVACAQHEFEYASPSKVLQTVHVSGTFNAWAIPGAPLAFDGQRWSLSMPLAAGSYTYKFVLDGKVWVPDPTNPQRESDTFGGFNSRLTVVCP